MKKFFAKMKKVRMMPWKKLTRGEKVLKFIMKAIKIAAIIALILAAGYVLLMIAVVGIMLMAIGFGDMGDYRRYR